MTTFVFANNIDTTLASSISSSATTITLSSGANLPTLAAGQTFVVTLNDAATQQIFEIMYATAISGTTLTVSRAQEGTTAQAWAAGDYVFSGPTAGQMRAFYQGQSVGQGSVTSVGMSMPSGFSVSGSPITVAGTLGVTFSSQNAGLFLATPVTGGAAGAATWRSMAAADVNGALGYTAANAANVVNTFNGRLGAVTLSSTDVNGALGYTAANDAAVVHILGSETVNGTKTFSTAMFVSANGSSAVSGNITGLGITGNMTSGGAEVDFVANWPGTLPAGFNFYTSESGATPTLIAQIHNGVATFDAVSATSGAFSGNVDAGTVSIGANPMGGSTLTVLTADGALLVRPESGITFIDSVTATNSAFAPIGMTATSASFNVGPAAFNNSVTCTTMNASSSDRRLKRDIKPFEPRPIHRSVPFVSYTLKENGWHGLGSVAQRMQKAAPEHVGEFDWHGKKRLSLDYGRAAYEEAMWAGLALDKALDRIKALEKRLAALERRV